jgi:EAL domain-containing protein (putative c-di-GMP-specific phosphodiesterase class I)
LPLKAIHRSADALCVVRPEAEQVAAPADWSAALQQVFAEPWRVRPAFQPIVDLERKQVWGFQVLARFISPLRATPPEWLEAAGRLGLRPALEARLLSAGLATLGEVPERVKLLFPLGPSTLLDGSVQKELRKHVTAIRHVVLDLTAEGEPVDVTELIDAVSPFRRDGGRIAVAAGSSPGGLDGLPRLRPDILKVGRDFVCGLESDPARRAVVEGLVQLVGALGGRLLAVGVEHESQLDALNEVGITLGQGFVLGRPVPSMAATVTRAGALLTS